MKFLKHQKILKSFELLTLSLIIIQFKINMSLNYLKSIIHNELGYLNSIKISVNEHHSINFYKCPTNFILSILIMIKMDYGLNMMLWF